MKHTQSIRKILADNIRSHRLETSMTQNELSEKSGVSTIAISRIENEKEWPNSDTLEMIADALNVSYIQLFYNPETDPPFTEKERKEKNEYLVEQVTAAVKLALSETEVHLPSNTKYRVSHKK